jgi:hypothetical protein
LNLPTTPKHGSSNGTPPSHNPPTSLSIVNPDHKRARSAPGSPQGTADPG